MTDTMQRYIDRVKEQDDSLKRIMGLWEEVREQHSLTIRQLDASRELVDTLSTQVRDLKMKVQMQEMEIQTLTDQLYECNYAFSHSRDDG